MVDIESNRISSVVLYGRPGAKREGKEEWPPWGGFEWEGCQEWSTLGRRQKTCWTAQGRPRGLGWAGR